MCFNISLTGPGEDVSDRFDASFDRDHIPIYHSSAFRFPDHPIICMDNANRIQNVRWGLVPHWVKDPKRADEMRHMTLNARSETIFEKPSFRHAIKKNRCLVPVDGFFEFREVKGKKFPYHIKMADERIFAMAGIYDEWTSPKGEVERTFSIVTAEANPLMEKIHNTKKRMPVILTSEDEEIWLEPKASREDLEAVMRPYEGEDLKAYPVSKLITERGADTNVPMVKERADYSELNFLGLDSFA